MAERDTLWRAGALSRLFPGAMANAASDSLSLREMPVPGQINLRGNPADPAFFKAAMTALGSGLPLEANTVAEAAGVTVYWLGPDEWLILTPPGAEHALIATLREALSGVHCAVVDVSGNRALIRMSGAEAREILAKGCSLDLHPRSFKAGDCAQTLIARCGVILHQRDDAPSYDLLPRRSFSEYLWLWLVDASAEYGVAGSSGAGVTGSDPDHG
ncbi:sarcosine oxidase subunit gamma family protein [Breoghania sp. L-A4]|uniref:sarcosine oxidase subunit gamma n=1 Tax=Breoghania sp. L-A4 TaxID=2304600 RepID=UPI000E35C4E2|nr:sarcosine oxidase subunit gamma family protein [Breoghania sp. L-A4]AXS42195.1 sarcosine oxidase subunit gamma [Breoghania sp. L-A4]